MSKTTSKTNSPGNIYFKLLPVHRGRIQLDLVHLCLKSYDLKLYLYWIILLYLYRLLCIVFYEVYYNNSIWYILGETLTLIIDCGKNVRMKIIEYFDISICV